jgi:hypothetical protein
METPKYIEVVMTSKEYKKGDLKIGSVVVIDEKDLSHLKKLYDVTDKHGKEIEVKK